MNVIAPQRERTVPGMRAAAPAQHRGAAGLQALPA